MLQLPCAQRVRRNRNGSYKCAEILINNIIGLSLINGHHPERKTTYYSQAKLSVSPFKAFSDVKATNELNVTYHYSTSHVPTSNSKLFLYLVNLSFMFHISLERFSHTAYNYER